MLSLFLFCIGLGLAVEGCHLELSHAQTKYCAADFIVKITVQSLRTPSEGQYYSVFGIAFDHIYKGKTFVDKLKDKAMYFSTHCGGPFPKVGKSYIIRGSLYEGKFQATEYDILETITEPSVEKTFNKRALAYDCSCGVDLGFFPLAPGVGSTVCVNPSPCKSLDYCVKENGKCTWKCM